MICVDIIVCIGVIDGWLKSLLQVFPLLRGAIARQVRRQDRVVVNVVLVLVSELLLRVKLLVIGVERGL